MPYSADGKRIRQITASRRSMTPETYVSRMSKVEGWLNLESAKATIAISATAGEMGVEGGSVEIGIHHGRFFILLHLLAPPSVAIDVFERQDLNVDGSGRGNREIFLRNCRRFGLDLSAITIFADSSENVAADQVVSAAGPVRLFSIDGGHTAHLTENDLQLAERCVTSGGVVILDDYFNPEWPDVSVGANRFLASSQLQPFAIAPNKLFLTNDPSAGERYRATLEGFDSYVGTKEMAGASVAVLASGWRNRLKVWLRRTGSFEAIGSSRLARPVVRVARNILSK